MKYSQASFAGKIGVARADITPPPGIYARSWGAAEHDIATGIHRPLFCKVLTLQNVDGENPLILATLDLGWWKSREDEWFLRGALIDEFQLDQSRILLSLSHTHSGPAICREDAHQPGGELIADYLQSVRDALLQTTQNALNSAREGVLEWTSGVCNLAQNRDLPDPDKPRIVCGFNPQPSTLPDDTVLVGRATDKDGRIFAVITNYACHPTTLAWQNQLISPDWCGAFHELVEGQAGATSLFLQGTSGELQARETYTDNVEIADAQGRQLGYAVLSALEGMLPPSIQLEYSGVVESGAPLAVWKRVESNPSTLLQPKRIEVELPLKDFPSVEEIESQLVVCEDRTLRERLTRKLRVRRNVGESQSTLLQVWLWRIGDAILVAQREEAYSFFQQELRMAFPDKTIIVMNLTNGSCGYLPPAELYDLDIYQVWQTPYERGGLERLTDAVIQQIQNL